MSYRPRVSKTSSALGGAVPSMVFPSHRYRGTPCQQSAGVWRSYLPPHSFLPVGIGGITPATNFAFFDFVSLHSLSYLWVPGRRHQLVFGLATPVTLHAGVALHVLLGDASGVTFTSTFDFDSCLGQRLTTVKSSRFCLCHPRGASCMADGTFRHSP